MNPRAKTLRSSLLLTCSIGVAAAALTGCTNTEGSLSAFAERYDKIAATKPPTACPDAYSPLTPGQADGKFLIVLSPVQGPDEPILFLGELTTPAVEGDVGLALTVTPLDLLDRKTPVGDPQTYGPVAVDGSGKFELEMALLKVPKEANTVIALALEANIKLAGNVCGDATFICGDVTGAAVKPAASLDGSTFTFMKIEDEAKYPDPVINCEETAAKAL